MRKLIHSMTIVILVLAAGTPAVAASQWWYPCGCRQPSASRCNDPCTARPAASCVSPCSNPCARTQTPCRPASCAKATITTLKADIEGACWRYTICVQYAVEIKYARCGEKFDLVMRVLENRCPVLNKDGKPMQWVVPLDCPTKVSCNNTVYAKAVRFCLPDGAICNPREVKVDVIVVPRGGGHVLAQRDRTPKYRR